MLIDLWFRQKFIIHCWFSAYFIFSYTWSFFIMGTFSAFIFHTPCFNNTSVDVGRGEKKVYFPSSRKILISKCIEFINLCYIKMSSVRSDFCLTFQMSYIMVGLLKINLWLEKFMNIILCMDGFFVFELQRMN